MRLITALILALGAALTFVGCESKPTDKPGHTSGTTPKKNRSAKWPTAKSPFAPNPKLEARINKILAQMTLEQKIGQMIQADIGSVTEEEMKQYRLGSVLNGGGQTPNNNPSANPQEWSSMAERLYQASISPAKGIEPIPVIWGVDAVHGHGNVMGATLYPHNIALGATRNPELVKNIGQATALEIAATGLDWNFAPTVAVARDDRWGRTYESFSEDPALVRQMGAAMVEGLQGKVGSPQFLDQQHVLACAKHFIGDGGTEFGDDQGNTDADEYDMVNIHLQGYLAALEAGAQTIMASYSWWDGKHSHENEFLLTEVLKQKLGFDGFVVSDWQAIGHINGCSMDSCPKAINAGVDLFMIPKAPDWQNFYRNTLAQAKDGSIPLARIDDAVKRILRVKMRLGLWDKPSPAKRYAATRPQLVGQPEHRTLARQAVRESLVLLKNNGVLPLSPQKTVLIAGAGAHSLALQTGGWSVTWQGKDNPNHLFPGATSIFQGFEQAMAAAGGRAILNEQGEVNEPVDAAIVVFGEQPYAESQGDIQNLATLEFEHNTQRHLKLINALKERKIPVIAVFLTARPLWTNALLNAADAFVVAWQPGTEGAGVADVLLRASNNQIQYEFKGKLPHSWPKHPCDTHQNQGDDGYDPLYALGFGLTYEQSPAWQPLSEDTQAWQYGCRLGQTLPDVKPVEFSAKRDWEYHVEKITLESLAVPKDQTEQLGAVKATAFNDPAGYGVDALWDGTAPGRVALRNGIKQFNLLPIYAQQGAVSMELKITQMPTQSVNALMFNGRLTHSTVAITDALRTLPLNEWRTFNIDLRCFARDRGDFSKVDSPIAIETTGQLGLSIRNASYQPLQADNANVNCPRSQTP